MEKIHIIEGLPHLKRRGYASRGRGRNQLLLARVKPGQGGSCIFGIDKKTLNSIRQTAHRNNIKLKIRELENHKYAVWRVT